MDGIANVARQQQSQMNSDVQGRTAQVAQQQVQQIQPQNLVKEMQQESAKGIGSQKVSTEDQVKDLVKKLNDAMAPMNTNLKFGVDSQDIFYVSVIESQTNKMIRRFPAEQAADFLPKMQEVSGMLFDTKG